MSYSSLHDIRILLNVLFTFVSFREVAILGTGYVRQGPNGTLTGMATQINSGEGDIAIGAAEFLEYRFRGPDGFSYIHPIFHSK
jgi:hypothetical protein